MREKSMDDEIVEVSPELRERVSRMIVDGLFKRAWATTQPRLHTLLMGSSSHGTIALRSYFSALGV